MSRVSRQLVHVPGAFAHVICRLVDGRFLFDDEARAEYTKRLERALPRTDWRPVSYAMMSSHLHSGFVAGEKPIESWIRGVNTGMAQWINRRSRQTAPKTLGHVFADRPTTKYYELADAGIVIAYQHNNPGDAGLVEDPNDSNWTSHRAYVGLDSGPRWLDAEYGLELSGFQPDEAGRREFHEFVCSRAKTELSVLPLKAASQAKRLRPCELPRHAFSARKVAEVAANVRGVPPSEVLGASRARSTVAVRRIALAAWCAVGGRMGEMARFLGISDSAASQLLNRELLMAEVAGTVLRVVHLLESGSETSET